MTNSPNKTVPDALLLLTSTCVYCPTVLAGLSKLLKDGLIGRLEAVNIEVHPEIAREYDVRTVPWVKLGPFQLEGNRSAAELRQWAERAGTPEGLAEYFHEILKSGDLKRVTQLAGEDPAVLDALLHLLADTDTELTVRIGVNAVFEALEGKAILERTVEPLVEISSRHDAHIRGDAAHLLSLTHDSRARAPLERLLHDQVADIRDIAREGLNRLDGKIEPAAH